MNRNTRLAVAVGTLLLLAGAWAWRDIALTGFPQHAEFEQPTQSAVRPRGGGGGYSRAPPAVAPNTGAMTPHPGGLPARQAAAEIFPGSVPMAGDWRNRHPAVIRVTPFPGATVEFKQTQVKEDGRHLTWIGRNADLPGASFVGV